MRGDFNGTDLKIDSRISICTVYVRHLGVHNTCLFRYHDLVLKGKDVDEGISLEREGEC